MAEALVGSVPPGRSLGADTAYDSDRFRAFLIKRGTTPVIPNNPTRKRLHPFDEHRYRARNLVERMFCRLKDWRRVATRYDKLAITFLSAVCLAAALTWWARLSLEPSVPEVTGYGDTPVFTDCRVSAIPRR